MSELRRIREARGLSQLELSIRTGVSQSTICTYEIGTRGMTLKTLRALADGLGVAPHDLIDKDTKMGLPDVFLLLQETIDRETNAETANILKLQLSVIQETYAKLIKEPTTKEEPERKDG